ncbi:MAG TPA: Gfo/Idh/MocA family oxidoreductase [Anaerohalosphaeraceae bacterium]|nr:Gfo/Idh/MocA family oxidoreductase [Anaerohalosphaeraceae bacterium]
MEKKDSLTISRRDFLYGAAGTAAFTIVPSYVLGGAARKPPSERLNIAGVGVGGMGRGNLTAVCDPKGEDPSRSENIVALCDVDDAYAAETFAMYPNAKRFRDFRVMLDEMGDAIDAVIVATPDHTHAVVALEAMKRGKHVYVQKPLTRTVYEARVLTEAARKYGVVTQMGNQGHSDEEARLICEWIWDGAIGPVREVHAWTNRPVWPQAKLRPTETVPVPSTLDWDLWIGPSPMRPYHPVYHPWDWRCWVDFGTGALGDMACHVLDPAFWALKLKYAESVQGSFAKICVEKWKHLEHPESYPTASIIHFEFPAREDMPPVQVHWYDGGLLPPRPDELEPQRRMGDSSGGVLFVGEKGKLMCGCYAKGPQLIPYSRMKEYKRPPQTLPRVQTSHEMNWVQACKAGTQATSNFDYAGPFTEMVLMGNLALFYPGQKLLWDGEAMRVTNVEEANQYVRPPYREGWKLEV